MNPSSSVEDGSTDLETVFVRTARGNLAARAPDADLPRMVKTLLIAVDGRTSVRMFQRLLPNFGDVGALLDALEAGAYIVAVGSVPRPPRPQPAPQPAVARVPLRVVAPPPATADAPSDSRNPSRWFESTQRFQDTAVLGARPGGAERPVDIALDARLPSFQSAPLSGHRSAVTEAARVREARTLMAEFLFAHLPDVALEAVLALERLESTEQIASNLGEYQRLIAASGRKGGDHLAEVRKVLSS